MKTTRVSSNWTLVLKVFVPTLWIVFFTLFTVAVIFSSGVDNALFGSPVFKLGTVGFYLLFFALIYMTLMKLQRVEYGDEAFTASNYFKTYRYRYKDVERIKIVDLLLKKLVIIQMKSKTSLGRNIYFLRSAALHDDFVQTHPHIFQSLIQS